MAPGDRHSLVIEPGGQSIEEARAIHVVLDVFLPGPDNLHWTVHMHGDLHRTGNTVNLEPPPEAAADQMVVDRNLVLRQAGDFRGRRLSARHDLRADPDVATIL